MPAHYNLPKSKSGAVGAVLTRILQILKNKSKSDRRGLEDRRAPDKEHLGEMPGLWKTAKQRKVMDQVRPNDPSVTASDLLRNPGKPARRRGGPRREDPTARSATRVGAITATVGVPLGVAAGVYNRKNKEKKNRKAKAMPDYTKGGTLKLRELKPHEIETLFHSGVKNPKINPSAKTKLSGVSKEKAQRDRMNTERIKKGSKTSIPQSTYGKGMKRIKAQIKAAVKKSNYHYQEGTETGFSGGAFGTAESRAKHRAISKKVGKKATALRKFTERDKKFR